VYICSCFCVQGHPRVIELVAKELQHDGQPQNILRYETYFREEVIPCVMEQVRGEGRTLVLDI
jgi:hypothetical protein